VVPKKTRQTNSGIGADATPFKYDVVDSRRRYVQPFRQFIGGHAQGLQELLPQNFAGMNSPIRRALSDNAHGDRTSVVIDDRDLVGIGSSLIETNSVLIVNSNTVLAMPVTA
jgi:hypothetical protein